MDLPDKLDSNARVGVRKGTGTTYERRRISLIEGTNVSFTVADDPTSEEVDVTVAVASAAPSGSAGGALDGTYPNPGLAASVAGAGLAETSDVLSVNVGTGLEISSDAVRIAAAAAGAGLTGGAGSALAVGAGTGITVNADDVAVDSTLVTLGQWTDWSTTITQSGTVTHTATYSRYTRVGRLIVAQAYLDITGTGTSGNKITCTLPVNRANTSELILGDFFYYDASTASLFRGWVLGTSGAQTIEFIHDGTGTTIGNGGGAATFGAANTDLLRINIAYESA